MIGSPGSDHDFDVIQATRVPLLSGAPSRLPFAVRSRLPFAVRVRLPSAVRATPSRLAPALAFAVVVICAMSLAPIEGAQAQYKYRSGNGDIVYSDMPPPDSTAKLIDMRGRFHAPVATPDLPYALQSVARRQPVTLYTMPDCPACRLARRHLAERGIPYAEKKVDSADGARAMSALGFAEGRFPVLSVGAHRKIGFEPGAWDQLLTAAQYPTRTRLPEGWAPNVSPLAEPKASPASAEAARNLAPDAGDSVPAEDASLVPSLPVHRRQPAIRF